MPMLQQIAWKQTRSIRVADVRYPPRSAYHWRVINELVSNGSSMERPKPEVSSKVEGRQAILEV